jgi:2-polyprenyl-3-methyl-5-hydroxy-6-metoxy-1,4-benzoquinol methylase
MGSQSDKWDRLAYIHDREREVACRAYLDLMAGRKTENVELALKLNLGSPMLIEVPYILGLIGDVGGKSVLDAGCGGGFYSLLLGEKGAKVLGIDGSEEMIKIAKKKASRRMLDARFEIGEITDLRIKDAIFDLVLSTLVLMEVKDLDKAVSELVRVTRSGGDIIISLQHPTLTSGDWERESGQKIFRKLDDYFKGKRTGRSMGGREERTSLLQTLPQTITGLHPTLLGEGMRLNPPIRASSTRSLQDVEPEGIRRHKKDSPLHSPQIPKNRQPNLTSFSQTSASLWE